MLIASSAAAAIDASVSGLPRSESSAARALQRRRADVGQRDRDVLDRVAVHAQRDGGGRGGEVADLALQLGVAIAGPRRGHRNADLGHDFVRLHQRVVGADEETVGRNDALARRRTQHERRAQRQHQRRMVVARIAVRDVAADRALVAHLRIGDQPRALDQQRALVLQQLRPDQLVLGRHRADANRAALLADALQLRESCRGRSGDPAGRSASSSSAAGCGRRRAASPRRRTARASRARRESDFGA